MFIGRAIDMDIPFVKPPSFLLNSTGRHSSLPRLHSSSGFSPTSSSNSAKKNQRSGSKPKTATFATPSYTRSLTNSFTHTTPRSKVIIFIHLSFSKLSCIFCTCIHIIYTHMQSLSDSGTSSGNAEFLSLSSSSQAVIHELEAEYESDSNDIGL